jgi:PPOX class probable F420-dependent enzyme
MNQTLQPDARQRFTTATVARLATVGSTGQPHLVPITFALLDDATLVTAVDHKPKRTTALRRLDNIAANPQVTVLVDHYDDDWEQLWWARADGLARVLGPGQEPAVRADALSALSARYPQYVQHPPQAALIVIDVERFSGWSAAYSNT